MFLFKPIYLNTVFQRMVSVHIIEIFTLFFFGTVLEIQLGFKLSVYQNSHIPSTYVTRVARGYSMAHCTSKQFSESFPSRIDRPRGGLCI